MKLDIKFYVVLLTLCAFLSTGCAYSSFGHRDRECDPDERLDGLLSAYEAGRSKGVNKTGYVLVDCERARNGIERLALEFPGHARTLMAAGTSTVRPAMAPWMARH